MAALPGARPGLQRAALKDLGCSQSELEDQVHGFSPIQGVLKVFMAVYTRVAMYLPCFGLKTKSECVPVFQ